MINYNYKNQHIGGVIMSNNRNCNIENTQKEYEDTKINYKNSEKFLVGIRALLGEAITEISQKTGMSIGYIYEMKIKVQAYIEGLDGEENEGQSIKVTWSLIRRAIVIMALAGRSTLEGIQSFFEIIFGMHISIGKISGIMKEASERAAKFDRTIDLSKIKIGANDEIFQGGQPILTGIDLMTEYIYLLEGATDRTAATWKEEIIDKAEQGLKLEESISDAAIGILKGVTDANLNTRLQLDVWHATHLIGQRVSIMERQAYSLITKEEEIKERVRKKKARKSDEIKLKEIEPKLTEAIEKYDIMRILLKWLRELIGFSGYSKEDTKVMVEYVLTEMEVNAKGNSELQKRINGFRGDMEFMFTYLEMLKEEIEKHSEEQGIPLEAYELMYEQLAYGEKSVKYNEIGCKLIDLLNEDYYRANADFKEILKGVKRASSPVENLNGRIRDYADVKRIIPTGFFALMKVYFNTKKFRRSRCSERKGKSPLELLTGKEQPGFLEAINF